MAVEDDDEQLRQTPANDDGEDNPGDLLNVLEWEYSKVLEEDADLDCQQRSMIEDYRNIKCLQYVNRVHPRRWVLRN